MSATIAAVAAFAAILGLGLGCEPAKPYDTQLNISFLTQPQGGLYVNTVTSTVAVSFISSRPIGADLGRDIHLSWAWHSPSGTYNADSKVYSIQRVDDQLTLSKSAPAGMYLDKKFWVTLTWEDATGDHSLTSDTADCRVN